jgi:hypothetical protein
MRNDTPSGMHGTTRAVRRTMTKPLRLGFSLVFVGAAALLAACSDTVDEVETHFDCHTVCKRFADCFNPDYDVDGCEDKCENSADDDAARQAKLDACADCIDDESCATASFKCPDECAGIVP